MKTPVGDARAHATFSASGAERWLNCPGSIALGATQPEPPESRYALEGTRAHACLEFLLKNRQKLDVAVKLALKQGYPEDMVAHGIDAVRYVMERHRALPGADLLIETRIDSSPFTCEGQFGTLDVALVQEFGRLVVIDYKYGAGLAVDPEGYGGDGNAQLMYYALGISHQYEHCFAEVELVVIQPRAFHASGNTTRSAVFQLDDLRAWHRRFKRGVRAAKEPDAPLASGAWCKFCRAALVCPQLKDRALEQARIVFSDDVGVQAVPEPRLVPAANLGVMLEACDRLDDWIKRLREHALAALKSGQTIDGYKLVQTSARRRWKDPETAADEAFDIFGARVFTAPELLSPAQLEKKLKGAVVPSKLQKWVRKHTVAESSGVTMVKETDRRLGVNPIESVFDVVVDVTPPKRGKR